MTSGHIVMLFPSYSHAQATIGSMSSRDYSWQSSSGWSSGDGGGHEPVRPAS
jgi:hypothetical protein